MSAGDADKGQCTEAGLAWGETYYWFEVSVPAPYNLPDRAGRESVAITINADGTTSPAGNLTFTFHDPESTIRTQATNVNLPNATISDSAWVAGLNNANAGSVTFYVYGPFAAAADITSTACAYTSPGGVPNYASGTKDFASATDATGVKDGAEYKYDSAPSGGGRATTPGSRSTTGTTTATGRSRRGRDPNRRLTSSPTRQASPLSPRRSRTTSPCRV